MEDSRNQELVQRLRERIEELGDGGMSKVSSDIGYSSSSAISQYLKGVYKSNKVIEEKLTEYFAVMDAAEDMETGATYVPTSISAQVYNTIRNCHLQGGLAFEVGDPGIGKTMAAEKYVADYPSSAYLLTVNPCFAGITSFLKLLCRTVHAAEGRKDDMWLNCAARLAGKKVLIIDEAQHIPPKTLEIIRALADSVKGLGIVFIGNRATVDNMGGAREAVFAQITSRRKQCKIRFTTQITADDIEMLFPVFKERALRRETELLLAVAQSKQGIRGATNLYYNARDNGNISYDGLIAMAKYMELRI